MSIGTNWSGVLLAGIAAFLIVIVVLWSLSGKKQTAQREENVGAGMEELAALAQQEARETFELAIDFSEASVETVEQILASYHQLHKQGELEQKLINRTAFRYGAYIGEVIRSIKGGHWQRDSEVAGKDSFPLHYDGHASYPVFWCYNRIVNGPEDNVWHKYNYFVLKKEIPNQFEVMTRTPEEHQKLRREHETKLKEK